MNVNVLLFYIQYYELHLHLRNMQMELIILNVNILLILSDIVLGKRRWIS